MYKAKVQNAQGNEFMLTGREAEYQVLSIIGLNPSRAQLNMTTIVGLDGAILNSAKLETKNIVITLKINGDAEENRQRLYDYFRTKEACRFFYSNGTRNVYIDGLVEAVECDLFSEDEQAQISLICPYPYFTDVSEVVNDISDIASSFVFPFSIEHDEPIPISSYDSERVTNVINTSDAEVGMRIVASIHGSVNTLEIRNTDTGESITINYSMQDLDVLTINTNKGRKGVSIQRNGVTTNIFSSVQGGSVFLQLHTGSNPLAYLADGGTSQELVSVQIIHANEYRGV